MGAVALYPRLPLLQRVAINFSTTGDNIIIAADPVNRIVIHRIWLVVAAATNLIFKDNLPSPAAVPMSANGGLTFDATGEPWFITNVNTAFIINQSGAVQVSGECYYTLAV
jgi:hypothetical protein